MGADLHKAEAAAKHAPKAKQQHTLKKVRAAAQKQLVAVALQQRTALHATIAQLEGHFKDTSEKVKRISEEQINTAKHKASTLRKQVKHRASKVMSKARATLKHVEHTSSATITASMESRQRARSHLVNLRAKHGTDEVRLAEAALQLAKVNKATHVLNVQARRAVRVARAVAAKKLHFARTMLASRLKAITSTEHLATEVVQEGQSSAEGALQKSAVQEFDGEISMGGSATGTTLRDEELLGQHAAAAVHAPLDTIYTAKMHRCTFPFKYNGEKFYSCKNSMHGHWCATKVDAAARVTEWDYCVLDKRVVGLAKQAAMEAAKLEITRMLHNTGAHIGAGALRESLRAAAAAQQQHKPAVDKAAARPSAEPKASPVMGAKDAAAKVDQ